MALPPFLIRDGCFSQRRQCSILVLQATTPFVISVSIIVQGRSRHWDRVELSFLFPLSPWKQGEPTNPSKSFASAQSQHLCSRMNRKKAVCITRSRSGERTDQARQLRHRRVSVSRTRPLSAVWRSRLLHTSLHVKPRNVRPMPPRPRIEVGQLGCPDSPLPSSLCLQFDGAEITGTAS